jgi:hypothetical protein
MNRRGFLASMGSGIGVVLAGCSGADDGPPERRATNTQTLTPDEQQTPKQTDTSTGESTRESTAEPGEDAEDHLAAAAIHLHTALGGIDTTTGSLPAVIEGFGANGALVTGALESAGNELDTAREADDGEHADAIEQMERTREYLSTAMDIAPAISSMCATFEGALETTMDEEYEAALAALRSLRADANAISGDIDTLEGMLDEMDSAAEPEYGPTPAELRRVVADTATVTTAVGRCSNGFVDVCKGGKHLDDAHELYEDEFYHHASTQFGAARWDYGNAVSLFERVAGMGTFGEEFETYRCVAEAHHDAADHYQKASVDRLVGRDESGDDSWDAAEEAFESECIDDPIPDDE